MTKSANWLKAATAITLVLLVLAIYGRVGRHDFVSFDDGRYVYENRFVMKGFTLEGLKWAFSFNDVAYWHPVTWLSHMLDCQLFSLDPGPPHLVNLLLHLINTGLVLILLWMMTGSYWKSLMVAGLFALHPMNVESVAWLAERKNLLSTFLGLSSLMAYVAYKQNQRLRFYITSLSLYTLGLMAKPWLVVFPALLFFVDYWCSGGQPERQAKAASHPAAAAVKLALFLSRRVVWEKIPFLVFAVLATVAASLSMSRRGIDIGLEAVSLPARVANGIISINAYIGKLFWPTDLVVFYPYPESVSGLDLTLALIACIGISAIAMIYYRKAPFLIFGWGWFVVALLPMLGLKQAGLWPALADRWVYVPYVGLFVALVWGCARVTIERGKFVKSIAIVAIAALFALSVTTYRQVTHWQNSMTLFQHAVTVDPDNDVAHNNLGAAYYQEGQFEQALFHFVSAIKIQPGYQAAHDNMATCLEQMGHGENLIEAVRQLADRNPGMPALYYHLGTLMEKEGDLEGAEKAFEKALQINPGFIQSLNALCRVLMKQGNYAKGLSMLKIRAAVKPVNAAVFYDIARIYAHFGDDDQAIYWLNKCKEKGFQNWDLVQKDPVFDDLKGNPSFRTLQNL